MVPDVPRLVFTFAMSMNATVTVALLLILMVDSSVPGGFGGR